MAATSKTKINLGQNGLGIRFRPRKRICMVVPEAPFVAKAYNGYSTSSAYFALMATKYNGITDTITFSNFTGTKYDGYTTSSVSV